MQAKPQGAPQQAGGLDAGKTLLRHGGGIAIEAHRRLDHAGGFEMRRHLAADARDRSAMHLLERARDAAVEKAAAYRAEFLVGHFADAVVGEVIERALFRDQAALPQFFQGLGETAFIPVGGRRQEVEGKRLADGRAEASQLIRRWRQLRQPGADHGVNARRCRLGTGAAQAGTNALDDKQRIPLGGAIEPGQFTVRQGAMGHLGGQLGRLGRIERRESKLHGEPGLFPFVPQVGEGMAAAGFFGADCPHDERLGGGIAAEQEMEPFERVGVAPLQVVDHQQERLARAAHGGDEGLEEMVALPALGQRLRAAEGGILLENFRQYARQFGQLRLGKTRSRRAQWFGAEPLGHGRVGQAALRGIAAGARHRGPAAGAPLGEFRGQARFADPRLTRDQRHAGGARRRIAPALQQVVEFRVAPDQRNRAAARRRGIRPRGRRVRLQDAFEQFAGSGIGLHGQFAPQSSHALVIGAQGAGAVAVGGVQADEHLVVRLRKRVVRDQPLGMGDGAGVVAAFLPLRGQASQHVG